jgi:leader peptidase (prepilin peptidase)/N-methyltransferase
MLWIFGAVGTWMGRRMGMVGGEGQPDEAMGGGDIKMMAMVGALTGWKSVLLTTFLGSLTGAVAGLFLMAFKGKGRKAKIPFGPFLALGALITLFGGEEIFRWYFHR